MDPVLSVSSLTHTISLAIAPVFLLTGIASILNVLAGRLARVVDRARAIESAFPQVGTPDHRRAIIDLRVLDRRIQTTHWAIACCTGSALLVCLLVSALFLADLADLASGRAVAGLFVGTMALIVVGLVLFLYEIQLATRSVRVRRDLIEQETGRWRA